MRFVGFLMGAAIFAGCATASLGQDYLVWDLDLNVNSGPVIHATLQGGGYDGDYTTDLSPYLGSLPSFCAVFICLGVYPDNEWLGSYVEEVDSLVSYITNYDTANIYMEGGDTWYFDPPTPLHPYFNIQGLGDGATIAGVLGRAGTFTVGMDFDYAGDNACLESIGPQGTAVLIFVDRVDTTCGLGVAYDNGGVSYRTIGTSFEFGGLVDGAPPSTKLALVDSIMCFFRCRCDYLHDCGVDSIAAPPDTVDPDSTYVPIAVVRNLGTAVETFDVGCLIDSSGVYLYGDTAQVMSLLPDEAYPCTFAVWAVPPSDSAEYTMTVTTLLAGDIDPSNDTLQKSIFAYRWTGVSEGIERPKLPEVFALRQSRPNPTAGGVEILYQLPRRSQVSLKVYNVAGEVVNVLVDEPQEPGCYVLRWDGQDAWGRRVASGVYFCRLASADLTAVRKLVVLR